MLYLYSKYFSFSYLPKFSSYRYSLGIVLNGVLLFAKSDVNTKLNIIGNEFDDIRKDVSDMCNLSQGIKEQAHAEGLAEAVIKLNKKGYSAEQISDLLDMAVEKVQKIIDNQA